jgi:hypothetical protein
LIRVLRELTSVQRKIADLQVELQGRKVWILYLWIGSEFSHQFFFLLNFVSVFVFFRMIKMLHIWHMLVKWRKRLKLYQGLLLFLKMLFIIR